MLKSRPYQIGKPLLISYYSVKPLIPRQWQIWLRRGLAAAKHPSNNKNWPIDPAACRTPAGWQGWPDGKRFAFVLTHDVDTARGHDRCQQLLRLDRELGFKSSFNFVGGQYAVSRELRETLAQQGFEVGVHGWLHNFTLYESQGTFRKQAIEINRTLREWGAEGFRSPSMYHHFEWLSELDIQYDASTFDTDPFEPQTDGMRTVFPFFVRNEQTGKGYIELPYTLPQDFTLFVLLREKNTEKWTRKLDWLAVHGGTALVISHPDYMKFGEGSRRADEYPVAYYESFLQWVKTKYEGQYWNPLPRELAAFWRGRYADATLRRVGRTAASAVALPVPRRPDGPAQSETSLQIVAPETDARWDDYVQRHPLGSIYHHSAWREVLLSSFGFEPYYVAAVNHSADHFTGILPLMCVRSRFTGQRLVSLPFTSHCTPLLAEPHLDEAMGLVLDQCPGVSYLELRYLGAATGAPALVQRDSAYVTHLLDLQPGPEQLFKAFHATSIRQRIKRAEKNGLKLRLAETEDDLQEFFKLHTRVRRKHGLPPHPFAFFSNMWRVLKPKGLLLVPLLELEGRIISGAMVLCFKDTFTYEYSAADQTQLELGPNQLLIWEVIKLACHQGARVLDLGRSARSHQSLLDFKSRWGAVGDDLTYGYYPAPRRLNTETGSARRLLETVNRCLPYWALRLEGRLLYRHLS